MCAMASVTFARHLHAFFPRLKGADVKIDASNVAELVRALDQRFPGLGFYLTDERGSLRQHVNIFVGEELVVDRRGLTDKLAPGAQVYVMQALSGG